MDSKIQISDLSDFLRERKVKIMETDKENAILIPLVEKDGEVHFLFEVRSDFVSQPGEVCFPGGRLENNEKPQDCALRETVEELGIPKHLIRLLGPFDILHNYTNVTIHPFVGVISYEDIKNVKLNEDEVKEIFLAPVSFFAEQKPFVYQYEVVPQIGTDFPYHMLDCADKYHWRRGHCTVPIFQYEGKIIWGITARIVCHFMESFQNEKV